MKIQSLGPWFRMFVALTFVIVVTVVATVSLTRPAYAAQPTQYTVLRNQQSDPEVLTGWLNNMSKQGWTFVQAEGPFLIFKK